MARPFVRADGSDWSQSPNNSNIWPDCSMRPRWVRATRGFADALRTQAKGTKKRRCPGAPLHIMDACHSTAAPERQPAEAGVLEQTAAAASPEEALGVALAWAEGRRRERVENAMRQAEADAEELRAALAAKLGESTAAFAMQLEAERSAHEEQVAALEQARDAAVARAALAEVAQATAQRRLERAVTLLGARTRHTVSDLTAARKAARWRVAGRPPTRRPRCTLPFMNCRRPFSRAARRCKPS